MERSLRVVLVTMLLLLLPVFMANSINAKTISQTSLEYQIIVDINGNGDFKSIQKAIDNAKSDSTILVKSGKYTEIIDINKKINLWGEDKKSTILCPISDKNKYAVRLGAQDIELRNLGIVNRAPGLYTTGIKVTSPNVEIDNCDIYDTPVGIAVWSEKTTIKNCEFRNCKDEGIVILGWDGHECNNNKIINCNFYENCDGIELQYSSFNTIENCRFIKNTHTAIDAIASSNNNNKIINCEIKNNEVNGIYFSSSSNNEIIDCEIKDNIDGNIRMNKNSKNNKVIFSNQLEEDLEDNSILKLISRLKQIKNSKLSELLSSINF